MPKKRSDEDILATARKRFKMCQDAEFEIRREAKIDLNFVRGEQWEQSDINSRNSAGGSYDIMTDKARAGSTGKRPCLTFNKLIGPLNQVANEARMNQPGIEVRPVDSFSDQDTADVIEGMIRHIEYSSKADQIYETALEQSAAGSFGYFRVDTRYCCDTSFDQEIYIEPVQDQFSVWIDPFAQAPDKSDMRFAFEGELIPREDYLEEYGETAVAQNNFYDGYSNPAPNWITKDGVWIMRYTTRESVKKKLVAIKWPDGKVTGVYQEQLPETLPPGVEFATDADGKRIERETDVYEVKRYKINGVEILDQSDWKGSYIPILPVLGKEMYIEGTRYLFSVIRFARDPQRLYNFYRSSEAETVMLGTKAPWVGVKGAFRDPRWASANTVPWSYLEYEPIDIAGNPAPPPQRNISEPPIQALSLGAAQASDDIKATTNIYDASLGNRSNETSGIAIQRRQNQAGLSNYHFVDNLNRAIRHCGLILCDLIPKIYDTAREVRILGEDRKQQIVKVNQQYVDEAGRDRCYDLAMGKYDVAITVGPSYTTQRQEMFETLTQMAQAYPQLLQIAGDLVFESADFPGGQKIADRLRKTLPPGLQDQPEGAPQVPPEIQAKVQQQDQVIQQLTQALQQKTQEQESKAIETASKERIEVAKIRSGDWQARLKARTDIITTEMKVKSSEDIALFEAEADAALATVPPPDYGAGEPSEPVQ